jgi:hypothetical protein
VNNSEISKSWDSKRPGIMLFHITGGNREGLTDHHILMSARLVLPPPESGIDEEENLWYL